MLVESTRTETPRVPLWQIHTESQKPTEVEFLSDLGTSTGTSCGSVLLKSWWCEVENTSREILPQWPVRGKLALGLHPPMDIALSTSISIEYGSLDLRLLLLEYSSSMALLEKAAEAGNEDTFVRAMYQVNWSQRPASDFVHAVHLALAAGAHLAARELAALGASKYATHSELRKMAHILAPPQVIKTDLPSTPWVQANRAWLRTHAEQYKGQWVALKDGELVGVAETASKLKTHLESMDGIMMTKVS